MAREYGLEIESKYHGDDLAYEDDLKGELRHATKLHKWLTGQDYLLASKQHSKDSFGRAFLQKQIPLWENKMCQIQRIVDRKEYLNG